MSRWPVKASFVDFRKKSKQIIQALRRNECVTVMYRGKPAAIMHPTGMAGQPVVKAEDQEAFGMWADRKDMKDVAAYVRKLRKPRFDAH